MCSASYALWTTSIKKKYQCYPTSTHHRSREKPQAPTHSLADAAAASAGEDSSGPPPERIVVVVFNVALVSPKPQTPPHLERAKGIFYLPTPRPKRPVIHQRRTRSDLTPCWLEWIHHPCPLLTLPLACDSDCEPSSMSAQPRPPRPSLPQLRESAGRWLQHRNHSQDWMGCDSIKHCRSPVFCPSQYMGCPDLHTP